MKHSTKIKNLLIAVFALSSAANVLPVEARANNNGGGGLYTGAVKVYTANGWAIRVVGGTSMAGCESNAQNMIRDYTWTFPTTGVSYVGSVVTPCHAGQTSEQPRGTVSNWNTN